MCWLGVPVRHLGEEVRKELMPAGARRKTWAVGKVWESSDSIYRHEAT